MAQSTEPCPADRWGDARTCWRCEGDIPIGSPAAKNQYGVFAHVACPDPTERKKATSVPVRQRDCSTVEIDLVDRVQLAMDNELPERPAALNTAWDSLDAVDRTAAAMGLLDAEAPSATSPVDAATVRSEAQRARLAPLLDAWAARGCTPPNLDAILEELPEVPDATHAAQQPRDLVDLTAASLDCGSHH